MSSRFYGLQPPKTEGTLRAGRPVKVRLWVQSKFSILVCLFCAPPATTAGVLHSDWFSMHQCLYACWLKCYRHIHMKRHTKGLSYKTSMETLKSESTFFHTEYGEIILLETLWISQPSRLYYAIIMEIFKSVAFRKISKPPYRKQRKQHCWHTSFSAASVFSFMLQFHLIWTPYLKWFLAAELWSFCMSWEADKNTFHKPLPYITYVLWFYAIFYYAVVK